MTAAQQSRSIVADAVGGFVKSKIVAPIAAILTPAARNSDPETSHEAAEHVTRSGLRSHQQRQVFAAVREWPGLTSAELAQRMSMNRHAVARRLPELRGVYVENGDARECTVTHRRALTWHPKED